ncbi:MAG: hypothetical protein AAGA81_19825 [Acidobacteriota bacterium]
MSRVVLTSPTTLIAKELGDRLAAAEGLRLSSIDLVSADESEVGVLADIGNSAAMVSRLEPEGELDADLIFCCGGSFEDSRPYLEARSARSNVVLFASDTPADIARPFLPWVDYPEGAEGATLLAPHPGVVMVASILDSLQELSPRAATATLLEPASMKDQAGMDEVLGQTRAMLAFEGVSDPEVFPVQQAFNLTASDTAPGVLSTQLGIAAPAAPPTSFMALRAGTFHSVGLSLQVRFDAIPELEVVRDALGASFRHDLRPELLGSMDAAAQPEILVGDLQLDPPTQSLWIWAAADNLTFGMEACGVEVARALLAPAPPN